MSFVLFILAVHLLTGHHARRGSGSPHATRAISPNPMTAAHSTLRAGVTRRKVHILLASIQVWLFAEKKKRPMIMLAVMAKARKMPRKTRKRVEIWAAPGQICQFEVANARM